MCAMFFPYTRSIRNVDTVTIIPVVVPFPQVKTKDFLKQAALNIISILSNPPSTTSVTLEAGEETKNTILKVTQALQHVEEIPKLSKNSSNVKDKINAQLPRVANDQLPPKFIIYSKKRTISKSSCATRMGTGH